MYCRTCGYRLEDGAKFCGVCGTRVISVPEPADVRPAEPAAPVPPAPAAPAPAEEPSSGSSIYFSKGFRKTTEPAAPAKEEPVIINTFGAEAKEEAPADADFVKTPSMDDTIVMDPFLPEDKEAAFAALAAAAEEMKIDEEPAVPTEEVFEDEEPAAPMEEAFKEVAAAPVEGPFVEEAAPAEAEDTEENLKPEEDAFEYYQPEEPEEESFIEEEPAAPIEEAFAEDEPAEPAEESKDHRAEAPAGVSAEAQEAFDAGERLFYSENFEEALRYYQRAADLQHPEGVDSIGWCFEKGLGTEQSNEYAEHYYRRAGEMGLAKGWRHLAFLLFFNAVDENDPKMKDSFNYMLKGAMMGDPSAQAHVGQAYLEGTAWGAPEADDAKGMEFLNKAMEQDNEHAFWVMAECYSHGTNGLKKDPQLALENYRKSAERGSRKGCRDMALITCFGLNGVEKNPREALDWAKKAYFEDDLSEYTILLGLLYMEGIEAATADMDYQKGKSMVEACAKAGLNRAVLAEKCISLLEDAFGKAPSNFVENIIWTSFMGFTHMEYKREDKELLAELQSRGITDAALSGDDDACHLLSCIFDPGSDLNKKFGGDKISAFALMEKWAGKAYEIDNIKNEDYYIAVVVDVATIDAAIGALEIAERKFEKAIQVLGQALSRPDYAGIYTDRSSVARIYVDYGSCQVDLGHFNEALSTFMTANRYMYTSDAFYGISSVYSDQGFGGFSWDSAVSNLVEADRVNYWLHEDNKARTYFLLGAAYRDPVFGGLIGTDVNRSYEYISASAALGFAPAQEDLPLYYKDIFGRYKFRG